MAVSIELMGSRGGKYAYGKSSELTLRYKVKEADSIEAAIIAVDATAPMTIVDPAVGITLYRDGVSWDQEGPGIYAVDVPFVDPQTQEHQLEVGEYRITFNTTGGTAHIAASKATIARYAPAGLTATNHYGAIGVSENGEIAGCDIIVPQTRFTIVYRQPKATITEAYVRTLVAMTGKVCDNTFKGYAAGEILFLGADGFRGNKSDPEISYQFAHQPNVSGLTIGSITGISKPGWAYLWVEFEEAEDAPSDRLRKQVRAVHVERVYDPANFAALGIGT